MGPSHLVFKFIWCSICLWMRYSFWPFNLPFFQTRDIRHIWAVIVSWSYHNWVKFLQQVNTERFGRTNTYLNCIHFLPYARPVFCKCWGIDFPPSMYFLQFLNSSVVSYHWFNPKMLCVRLNVFLFLPNVNEVWSPLFPWKALELLQLCRDVIRESRICRPIIVNIKSQSSVVNLDLPRRSKSQLFLIARINPIPINSFLPIH